MGPEVVKIDIFHFPELLWQPDFLIEKFDAFENLCLKILCDRHNAKQRDLQSS